MRNKQQSKGVLDLLSVTPVGVLPVNTLILRLLSFLVTFLHEECSLGLSARQPIPQSIPADPSHPVSLHGGLRYLVSFETRARIVEQGP